MSVVSNYDATGTEETRHQETNVWSDPESLTREEEGGNVENGGHLNTLNTSGNVLSVSQVVTIYLFHLYLQKYECNIHSKYCYA